MISWSPGRTCCFQRRMGCLYDRIRNIYAAFSITSLPISFIHFLLMRLGREKRDDTDITDVLVE